MRRLALGIALTLALTGPALAQQGADPQKEEAFTRSFVGGLQALTARRLPEAIALFNQCTKLFGDRPVAYYNLACAYSIQNEPQKATENLRKAFVKLHREVVEIQSALTGKSLNADELIKAMLVAFDGDPEHGCMGRSAPARLQRALEQADSFRLAVPRLRAIAEKQ